jgi:hypothetical protein
VRAEMLILKIGKLTEYWKKVKIIVSGSPLQSVKLRFHCMFFALPYVPEAF